MDVKTKEVKKEDRALKFEGMIGGVLRKITPEAMLHPVCFAVSFLLSRSVLLGSIAPFGLSASGALGTSNGSVCGILGACLGYITMIDSINSLKYIACVILIYTAHFVFNGMSLSKSKIFVAFSYFDFQYASFSSESPEPTQRV